MNRDDLARTVDTLAGWTPPEGVLSKVYMSYNPTDSRVEIVLAVGDYSIAIECPRPPLESDLQRLTQLAEELLDWAADEVVSIAGHEWN